jgi:hypothetical protein
MKELGFIIIISLSLVVISLIMCLEIEWDARNTYLNNCKKEVLERAHIDLKCPKKDLKVECINRKCSEVAVVGCGQSSLYIDTYKGWKRYRSN